jgi:NADH-quinone oxidoreductase subunit A
LDNAQPLWPWLVYAILVVFMAATMLGLSYVLGQRHNEPSTGIPYESGMTPTGSARVRFPTDFYLIALFFIVFDVESVFIVTWAIGAKVLGWTGFVSAAIFIGILFVALLYLWRVGALEVGPTGNKRKGA